MSKDKTSVIHGRFQMFHVGHLEYLLAGAERCDTLVVGITNPDPWQIRTEESDAKRGSGLANICTYYERLQMVDGALTDSGIPRHKFRIVPFPICYPERIGHYAPADAEYLLSIYDEWGEEKLRRLKNLGLTTHVLWRRTEKVTTGTAVRRAIGAGLPWEHLVPAATARVIRAYRIDVRIRAMQADPMQVVADSVES